MQHDSRVSQSRRLHKSQARNVDVAIAIQMLSEVAGVPHWFAKNIVVWRFRRGLPINIVKVVTQ